MFWKQLVQRKSLERLLKEMEGENRLRRVLGPIALTSLGVGAIIGAGIFVMTGETAANRAGPAVLLSFVFAGMGCGLAALCYAEFASLAPVAGSAYTYAYATLGELFAWIIGWDLILEYAMSCGTLAADWTKYFNEFTKLFGWQCPDYLSYATLSDEGALSVSFLSKAPWFEFTVNPGGAWFSLPAVIIMALSTVVLVIGIRESATTNAVLVATKVGVVLFVIAVGVWYINPENWTGISPEYRKIADVSDLLRRRADVRAIVPPGDYRTVDGKELLKEYPEVATVVTKSVMEEIRKLPNVDALRARPDLSRLLPDEDFRDVSGEQLLARHPQLDDAIAARVRKDLENLKSEEKQWGMIALLGLHRPLASVDDKVRSPFMPYGISGILVAAAFVFFAYIGFDAISTHSEEARRPQRDVPIGILASLAVCTLLYLGVSAVITGMEPYPIIDPDAAVAEAFSRLARQHDSVWLKISAGLIALGALAGMTSVILITLLSQARIFLAMARDGLLSERIFGAVHPRFRTPHISTILTGALLCVVTALTPIDVLTEMVNIGTLLAFVIVCAAVLLLRIRRPDAHRPFRTPLVYFLAPAGILVNLTMMMFLPLATWYRLVGWLVIGFVIYFAYGMWHSRLREEALSQGNSLQS
jgi:APA family basic amino acid/polyamine antiporter